jgi:hypothetical protein
MKARTLQAVAAVRNSERYVLRMIPPFYPYDLPSVDIGAVLGQAVLRL